MIRDSVKITGLYLKSEQITAGEKLEVTVFSGFLPRRAKSSCNSSGQLTTKGAWGEIIFSFPSVLRTRRRVHVRRQKRLISGFPGLVP